MSELLDSQTTENGTKPLETKRDRIDIALFQLGYRNQVPGIAISTSVLLLLVFGFGSDLPRPYLWWWFAWMLGVELIGLYNRWTASRAIRQRKAEAGIARKWRAIYMSQVVLGGIGWGNLGVLYGDSVAQNAVLLIVFFGVASLGSNLSAAHHYRAMATAMPVAILFQVWHLPDGFGERATTLQGMLLVYLLLLLISGRNIHRNILDNIQLHFDNESIVRSKIAEAERADKANLDKSHFLAAASHDLRQPVHALLLLVAAMKQRCSEAAQVELIDHIQQAGFAIVKLFNALMELSRLESGVEVPDPQPVAMRDFLTQLIARHAPEAAQKSLSLELVISTRAMKMHIRTDRILFNRLLDNLVGNALRYTHHGRVLITLRARTNGAIWLDICDTGIGIDAADLTRIFEPYVQVGNIERDRTKGLGLGLAIVRQTSKLLDCPVEVASTLGKGSRFRLRIDHLRIADAQPEMVHIETRPRLPELHGKKILVVDDDLMVQNAMMLVLRSWHAEVLVTGKVDEVTSLIEQRDWTPDCIVCDYRLAGETSGIELLNQMTERFPHAVGILQTGELDPAVHERAEDAGYILLKKPVAPDLLAATLSGFLSESRENADPTLTFFQTHDNANPDRR